MAAKPGLSPLFSSHVTCIAVCTVDFASICFSVDVVMQVIAATVSPCIVEHNLEFCGNPVGKRFDV